MFSTGQQARTERETATGRLLAAYREDGDVRARDRLVQLYLPLVEAFAHRYGRRGAEVEDLIQVGSIGLLGAIDRFDAKRGDEFTAFAVPTIAGEIKRHLRDRTGAVTLPRRLREAGMRLPEARRQLTTRLGRAPTAAELAAELGIEAEELVVVEQNGRPADADASETSGPEVDLDERILLAGAFQALDETERSIVYLRFVRELSRRDTAKELGMTDDRLRRRTQAALAKLRGELERTAFPGAAPAPDPKPVEQAEEPDKAPPASARPSNGAEHSGRLLVRMPPTLHDDLAHAAEKEEVSLNQFITNALSSAVGWQQGAQPARRDAPPRWLPAAIVANIVVLALAGIAAVVLLIVAWQQGF